jgi:hypothetical protein
MSLRVTNRPWFGPKRTIGWGWTPVSWQGVVVSVVFLVLVLASVIFWQGWGAAIAVPVLVGLLLVVCLLTGDPPG